MWTIAPAAFLTAPAISSFFTSPYAWPGLLLVIAAAAFTAAKRAMNRSGQSCGHVLEGECDECWEARQW